MTASFTAWSDNPADIAIIGGGPTGLFAAFYAGLRQMSMEIIDSLPRLGGQLSTLYPEKYIYDVPGFPRILASDLVNRLMEQAMQYQPRVCLGEEVGALEEKSGMYTVHTARGAHSARAILVAAGAGAFVPRKLAIARAAAYEGRGLYYTVERMEDFAARHVLVVGGGDSAVDWAGTLTRRAAEVTLIHRSDRFRAHQENLARLRRGPAKVRPFSELREIGGRGGVEYAVIYDNRSKSEQTLRIDAVLVNIGFAGSLGAIADWGLALHGGRIEVDSAMQTSRPGIFAAGDIATYPGKLRLIATGFSEAAVAVNHAKHYLDPGAKVFPGHSSETGDVPLGRGGR